MAVISKHPFEPYIPTNATKLIIGTMPPYRFCVESEPLLPGDVGFYYGSVDNGFWDLMSTITGMAVTSVKDRKKVLDKLNAGITDVVDSCEHYMKNSDDGSLKDIKAKNISALLSSNSCKSIKTLVYTSLSIQRQIINQFADDRCHHWCRENKRHGKVYINGKEYNVIVLYSPSKTANRGLARTAKKENCSIIELKEKQYKEVFLG